MFQRGVGHGALRDPGGPQQSFGHGRRLAGQRQSVWTDNAAIATAYTVERSVGTTGVWTVIASNLSATATS